MGWGGVRVVGVLNSSGWTKIRRGAAVWRQRPGEWRLAHSGSLLPSVDGCFRLVVRGRGFGGEDLPKVATALPPPPVRSGGHCPVS